MAMQWPRSLRRRSLCLDRRPDLPTDQAPFHALMHFTAFPIPHGTFIQQSRFLDSHRLVLLGTL